MNLMISAPNFADLRQIKEFIEQNFASVNTVWLVEHQDDGRHGSIHADAVDVRDAITIGRVTPVQVIPFVDDAVLFAGQDAFGTRVSVNTAHPHAPFEVRAHAIQRGGFGTPTAIEFDGRVLSQIANFDLQGMIIGATTDRAASGTHQLVSTLVVTAPDTFGGGGVAPITNLATLVLRVPLGTATNVYSLKMDGSLAERGRTAALGAWIPVPFNAANFTGNGAMTWTVAGGNVVTNRYTLIGTTMIWTLRLATTSVGGTLNTQLLATIPGGFTAVTPGSMRLGLSLDNGADVHALAEAVGTQVQITKRTPAGNWAASANATWSYFTLIFEVQ